MPKSLIRIVAFLLVPCLIADPTQATVLLYQNSMTEQHTIGACFQEQAIVPSSFISRQTDPLRCVAITEMAVEEERRASENFSAGSSRRGFLENASSMIGLSSLVTMVASTQDRPRLIPAFASDEEMRVFVVEQLNAVVQLFQGSRDPVQKEWAQAAGHYRDHVQIAVLPGKNLLGQGTFINNDGSYRIDEKTRFPQSELQINRNFLQGLTGLPKSPTDWVIQQSLIKEIGGLVFIREHLGFYAKVRSLIKEIRQITPNNIPVRELVKMPNFRRRIEELNWLWARHEASGYVASAKYWTQYPDKLKAVRAFLPSLTPDSWPYLGFYSAVGFYDSIKNHLGDEIWVAAMRHFRVAFIAGRRPGPLDLESQADIFLMAAWAELAEGRAVLKNNGALDLRFDPQTLLPPSNVMDYIRKPNFVPLDASPPAPEKRGEVVPAVPGTPVLAMSGLGGAARDKPGLGAGSTQKALPGMRRVDVQPDAVSDTNTGVEPFAADDCCC